MLSKKKILIMPIIFWVIQANVFAQNDSTNVLTSEIKWSYDKTINLSNGDELNAGGYFTINESTIIWAQAVGGNNQISELPIIDKTINWSSISSIGSVVYEVTLYNIHGTVIVRRDNVEELTIKIDFTGDSFEDMVFEYPISTFEVLNQ